MDNASAAAQMIRGATITMGDGSVYDYLDPMACQMSLEDYAWGLAAQQRFSGQTRIRALGWKRALYCVAEHCVRGSQQALDDGKGEQFAFRFLTHESGEVVCGDAPSPMKVALPEFRPFEKAQARGIDEWFGWEDFDPQGIKRWDLRMLATEYRDLLPPRQHGRLFQPPTGYDAFDQVIVPYHHPAQAVKAWLALYAKLAPSEGLGK